MFKLVWLSDSLHAFCETWHDHFSITGYPGEVSSGTGYQNNITCHLKQLWMHRGPQTTFGIHHHTGKYENRSIFKSIRSKCQLYETFKSHKVSFCYHKLLEAVIHEIHIKYRFNYIIHVRIIISFIFDAYK